MLIITKETGCVTFNNIVFQSMNPFNIVSKYLQLVQKLHVYSIPHKSNSSIKYARNSSRLEGRRKSSGLPRLYVATRYDKTNIFWSMKL